MALNAEILEVDAEKVQQHSALYAPEKFEAGYKKLWCALEASGRNTNESQRAMMKILFSNRCPNRSHQARIHIRHTAPDSTWRGKTMNSDLNV